MAKDINKSQQEKREESYEFNSYNTFQNFESIFGFSLIEDYSQEEISGIVQNPIQNHSQARQLSKVVYNKSGVISNVIDYMVSLPCLDRIITSSGKNKKKVDKNKELMLSTLETIKDKSFIRDALFRDMLDGICFYYFETTSTTPNNVKFLSDYEVENIFEINDLGLNSSIISLPYEHTKIVGSKNSRYVIAFNLDYFKKFSGNELIGKLRKFPKEIRDGYYKNENSKVNKSWLVLDNSKTIVHKIKSEISEPWGRPLSISALDDLIYQDYFVSTKRNVLNELNNQILYQTFPEGEKKGTSSLTGKQQKDQHNTVKDAVMKKNNKGGTSFFSVAAGTKLDSIKVSTDIFDEKNEASLNDQVALDVGMAASLLNGSSSGNYSSQQNNLDLIFSQVYSWIEELRDELNTVINKNIIKDRRNKVSVYYLPTSLTNRKQTFEYMKSLYTECSGSLQAVIAASGFNVEAYLSLMDEEVEKGFDEKYKPHQTSYTMSSSDTQGGRPENANSTNPNTQQSRANGSSKTPKPSNK